MRPALAIISFSLVAAVSAAAMPELRSAIEVNRLSQQDAAGGHRVNLTAIVTYCDPEWGLLFVEDPTGALFVNIKGTAVNLAPGSRIRLEGVTMPGDLAPVVTRPLVTLLGKAGLPEPIRPSIRELEAGSVDSRWVEARGVVRQRRGGLGRVTFDLHYDGAVTMVMLPLADYAQSQRLVDSVVRVRGVCGSKIRGGKRTGATIFVSSPDDISVDLAAAGDPFSMPETPPGEIGRLARQPLVRRVRVRGEVTHRMPDVLWVENASGAAPVQAATGLPVSQGDFVDVIGFPAMNGHGAGLTETTFHLLSSKAAVERPIRAAAEVIDGRMHGRLVRLRAQLVEQSGTADTATLLLESGPIRFTAKVTKNVSLALPRDAVVEITGVAALADRPGQATPALSVLVRDLKVLHQAGAMARDKVLLVVLAVSLIALGALAWLVLLRRTVRKQTGLIRARLEREARLESDYRRLFERNPAGVFRLRPDGRILDANPAFAHMLNAATRDALIGRSYWDFEPEGRKELEDLKAGSVVRREVPLRRSTGGDLWLIEHVCAVDTPEGLVLEATAIDVTEKRRYRQELMAAKDQLEDRVRERTADLEGEIARRQQAERELIAAKALAEQMSSAKSSFLASMSHELRTPLNAVIGYSEMLTEQAEEDGKTAYLADLERIRAAGKHLLALINDILDLSKIEAGRMEVRPERIRVEDIVQDVLATVEPMARKAGNTLRADCSDAPPEVVADPMRFRQSLLNLLSNACKFTENGEVELTVNRAEGGWVEWSVADTGVGMSEEQQQRLFQPFSQVDDGLRTKFSGTGLGLVISRRFCQLMGGDIRVSSAPGEGSRFVIRIPDEVTPPES